MRPTLLSVPEYTEALARWSPAKEDAAFERAARGEQLTLDEEFFILFRTERLYPEEFRAFCRRVLEGCSAERLAKIAAEYEALQALFVARQEQRRRASPRKNT